jgi:hypothetical protein
MAQSGKTFWQSAHQQNMWQTFISAIRTLQNQKAFPLHLADLPEAKNGPKGSVRKDSLEESVFGIVCG